MRNGQPGGEPSTSAQPQGSVPGGSLATPEESLLREEIAHLQRETQRGLKCVWDAEEQRQVVFQREEQIGPVNREREHELSTVNLAVQKSVAAEDAQEKCVNARIAAAVRAIEAGRVAIRKLQDAFPEFEESLEVPIEHYSEHKRKRRRDEQDSERSTAFKVRGSNEGFGSECRHRVNRRSWVDEAARMLYFTQITAKYEGPRIYRDEYQRQELGRMASKVCSDFIRFREGRPINKEGRTLLIAACHQYRLCDYEVPYDVYMHLVQIYDNDFWRIVRDLRTPQRLP